MIDIADTKRRSPLRSIMERDGMAFRNSGSSVIAICPFHDEGTPSLHLHETADGGWFKCFGCDAKGDALNYLKLRHGMDVPSALEYMGGRSTSTPINVPVRTIAPEVVVEPIGAEDLVAWGESCDLFPDEVENLAKWRGLRQEVIEWAARRRLCGRVSYMGATREAFAILRADGAMLGEHIRLAPKSSGNSSSKASWRYRPSGIGAWPFAVVPSAGISGVKYVFVTEGQWDALALIDVMGWEKSWPESIAVFGMRGATSWKKLLEYTFDPKASFFLIADHDAAGERWFTSDESISFKLEERGFRVWGFWPAGVKDLNEAVAIMSEQDRLAFRELLRAKIPVKKSEPRPTFRQWLAAQKGRADLVGELGKELKRGLKVPPARAPFWKWQTFAKEMNWNIESLDAAWKEWKNL